MSKYKQYYLDLDKVGKLPDNMMKYVQDMYRDMIFNTTLPDISDAMFETLKGNGYLISQREKKINNIIGDKDIDN